MSAVTERPADLTGTQLITLDPVQYVTAVYLPFRERLDAAKAAVANIETVDVSNREAMAVAIKHRAAFRAIRVEAEAARKQRKAPVLEIGKLLDGRYRELEQEISADEDRFDAAIKAEESRKERERAEKEAAEKSRVAAIHDNLARLTNAATAFVGKSSAAIAEGLERLRAHDVTTWAQEFAAAAKEAHSTAIAALTQLYAGAVAQEQAAAAEAKRVADERAELARLRAEQAERERTEAARIEEENRKRAADEAAARARIEEEERQAHARIAEADRATREAREAEEARMQAERDRLDAISRAVEAEARAKREAEEAAAKAIRDAEEARQRAERERLEHEARALAEQQRAATEREEAAQREIERRRVELMDGAELLQTFVARFGSRREFAGVVKAIKAYLATQEQQKAAA